MTLREHYAAVIALIQQERALITDHARTQIEVKHRWQALGIQERRVATMLRELDELDHPWPTEYPGLR